MKNHDEIVYTGLIYGVLQNSALSGTTEVMDCRPSDLDCGQLASEERGGSGDGYCQVSKAILRGDCAIKSCSISL